MSSTPASSSEKERFVRKTHAAQVVVGGALALAFAASPAMAQPASKDSAMAETLFEEAKDLMQDGDFVNACPKLAESYRLDPGSGTLTALAMCHEKLNKTATAWAEFIEVVTEAQQAGRADREKFARQHVTALEPHLSRLMISVAPETARLPDVQVRRDRVVVGSAAWGVASPVDPGEHLIEATAPGHKAWATRVTVGDRGDKESVDVPALEEKPEDSTSTGSTDETPAAPKPAADAPHRGDTQRIASYVVGGAGIVSLGLGTTFGLLAISKSSAAKGQCSPAPTACPPSAIQENSEAKSDALLSDVTLGVGVVAVGVGLYLLLSAPSDQPPPATDAVPPTTSRVRWQPVFGRNSAGMSIQGDF
jgi:hypothetical protein